MAIQMRRGPLAKYDKNKMLAGEWGISIDADTNDQKAMIAFAPGVDKEVMFVEDAAAQIAEATAAAIDTATEEAEAWAHGNSFHVNDYASGNGSTRSFTLAQTPSLVLGVYVDGAAVTAYSRSGKTITFTTAPAAGQNNIRVYYTVSTSTDNAKYYKEQASESASSASSYASQAASSMNIADQAANAAFEQAQTATTKANEASASATAAATSDTNASSSATAASTSAGQAASSATAASGSATEAREARDAAIEAAEQAEAAASQSAAQASIAEVYDATKTYAIGDYCLRDGQLYECTTEITTPEAWAAAHWTATTAGTELNDIKDDVSGLKEDLTTKAEQDGAYPDLTAGQLLSKVESADSVPYNFRAVGHDATLEYTDAIVGGSVVANQQAGSQDRTVSGNGITISFDHSTGKTTVTVPDSPTGFAQLAYYGTPAVSGHRYLICADKPLVNGIEVYIGGTNGIRGAYPAPKNQMDIVTATESSTTLQFFVGQSTSAGTYEYYVQIVDLTLMLGTVIADYVLSLETATAGSGVAWLKANFPKIFGAYQPYNAGEIISVQGLSEHKTVGFNQWDETWENCIWNESANGVKQSNANAIGSKDYIPALPSTTYCLSRGVVSTFYALYYDADHAYLGYSRLNMNTKDTFTTPDGCNYITFYSYNSYGNTYNHDICINLSDSTKNGTYEPYQKHTYPLDDSLTLRGILKLDSNNQLYADGDRYLPDGTVQRRYGIVDLGTLDWTRDNRGFWYRAKPTGALSGCDCVAEKFVCFKNSDDVANAREEGLTILSNNIMYICNSDAVNKPTGYLIFELATPTTENADPYTVPQIVDPNGTEEYVSTSIVPVGHESRYPDDLRAKLDGLPWNLSMIAPIENGDKASQAYVVGKYFLHNNQFCKAKTAIASGATLTLNTNYEVTTVADEIYSALH